MTQITVETPDGPQPLPRIPVPPDDAPVSVLGSGSTWSRVLKIMFHQGIRTVGQFRMADPFMITRLPGVGKVGRRCIEKAYAKLDVRQEPPMTNETITVKDPDQLPRVGMTEAELSIKSPLEQEIEADQPDTAGIPNGAIYELIRERQKQIDFRKLFNLAQRREIVMIARGYIEREEVGEGAPFRKAVPFDKVVRLIRPLMIQWGIGLHPIKVEQLSDQTIEKKGTWFYGRFRWTFRVYNVDDPSDHDVVEVISSGLDQQDKGEGKASTYAMKFAILRYFVMEYGDDPDFTPMDLGPDMPEQKRKLIDTIRELEEQDPKILNRMDYERGVCATYAEKYQTKIANIHAMPDNILLDWAKSLAGQLNVNLSDYGLGN